MSGEAKFPMTVREASKFWCVSKTTIRRWISGGYLRAAGKPLKVTGGEPPVTVDRWEKEIGAAARQSLRPGTYGFEDGTHDFVFLSDNTTKRIRRVDRWSVLKRVCSDLLQKTATSP